MKKRVFCLMVVILFSLCGCGKQEVIIKQSNKRDESKEQVEVITDYINIRKGNDVNSDILGKVSKGDIYTIIDKFDDSEFKLILIETSNGIKGYISGTDEYVKVLGDENEVVE